MLRAFFSLVLLLLILPGAAYVALGADRLASYLPDAAASIVLDLDAHLKGALSGGAKAGTPEELLADTAEGLVAEGPIAALAGNVPVFTDQVIAGHTTRVARAIPAEITTIRPILGCLLTRPDQGMTVGYATAGRSGLPLAMATYGDPDLARAVEALVDSYRKTATAKPVMPENVPYEVTDVAVTETKAPVFLVLESREGNRIWNIHLAPGARVDRVVLLGGAQVGVANLDPVVPVEVLLDGGLQACGIVPAHPLNDGNALRQPQGEGGLKPSEVAARLAEVDAAVTAYDRWFRDSFGVSTDIRAGFDRGVVSVIGPVPATEAERATYASLEGADIRTTQDTYFEITGQVPAGRDFASRVLAITTGFALGDLTTLRQGIDF